MPVVPAARACLVAMSWPAECVLVRQQSAEISSACAIQVARTRARWLGTRFDAQFSLWGEHVAPTGGRNGTGVVLAHLPGVSRDTLANSAWPSRVALAQMRQHHSAAPHRYELHLHARDILASPRQRSRRKLPTRLSPLDTARKAEKTRSTAARGEEVSGEEIPAHRVSAGDAWHGLASCNSSRSGRSQFATARLAQMHRRTSGRG